VLDSSSYHLHTFDVYHPWWVVSMFTFLRPNISVHRSFSRLGFPIVSNDFQAEVVERLSKRLDRCSQVLAVAARQLRVLACAFCSCATYKWPSLCCALFLHVVYINQSTCTNEAQSACVKDDGWSSVVVGVWRGNCASSGPAVDG
jgi:hypothetical protein